MKKLLTLFAAICFCVSFVFIFCLVGYSFTGFLIFVLGAFLIYLALSIGITKRALIILRRIVVALAALGIGFTAVMTGIVIRDMRGDVPTPCDYVIVLGAGLDKETPSLTLVDRLNRTVAYMNEYPSSIAIVSGSQGSDETITEALAMERYLVSHGIPRERIIKEEKARNTNENLIYSREIIDSRGGGSAAIISSDYHIFRTRLLAKKQGLPAVMLSAVSSLPVLRINYAIREAFALVKAKLLGNI